MRIKLNGDIKVALKWSFNAILTVLINEMNDKSGSLNVLCFIPACPPPPPVAHRPAELM